jgi:hypothetical protein
MQSTKSFTQKQTPYITTISSQNPKSSIRENKQTFGLENNLKKTVSSGPLIKSG